MEQITPKLMDWASILDQGAREQAVTSSTMPFIHPHLALMPDAHLGMGATLSGRSSPRSMRSSGPQSVSTSAAA